MSSNNPPQVIYDKFIAYICRVCEYVMTIYRCDARLPKHLPMVHLDSDNAVLIPSTECGDPAGGVAFDIDFDAYPNLVLRFSTDSICEILYSYGEELSDGAKHELLSRISRAFLQYIYNEANRVN